LPTAYIAVGQEQRQVRISRAYAQQVQQPCARLKTSWDVTYASTMSATVMHAMATMRSRIPLASLFSDGPAMPITASGFSSADDSKRYPEDPDTANCSGGECERRCERVRGATRREGRASGTRCRTASAHSIFTRLGQLLISLICANTRTHVYTHTHTHARARMLMQHTRMRGLECSLSCSPQPLAPDQQRT
jgi:hypothetical protein